MPPPPAANIGILHSDGIRGIVKPPPDRDPQPLFEVDSSIGFRLVRLMNHLTTAFEREIASRCNVSLVQWRVLAVLARHPRLSAADIAAFLGHTPMSVGRAIQQLERRRKLARTTSERDRRRIELELTAAGRELYQQVAPFAIRREQQLLAGLGANEILVLSRLLDVMLRSISDTQTPGA